MGAVAAADILRIWEKGQGQRPVGRALTLLGAACPEMSGEELAALTVGQRDARLFDLREQSFGREICAFVECPQCAERLELAFRASDIRGRDEDEPGVLDHECNGLAVRFRLPNSADLAEAVATSSVAEGREVILQRCVLEARRAGELVAPIDLPAAAQEEIARRMAAADSAAEVLLDMACPACSHRWQALFDIASFFWLEVAAQARRLLREVDALARTYGWREAEILGMNAQRRQAYLELIRA